MSRNSFRQIEAQINEYEDMRAHAGMERNADLYARSDNSSTLLKTIRNDIQISW